MWSKCPTEGAHCHLVISRTPRTYLDKIDRQKKQHWKEFLDDPQNIWKAASYAKPSGAAMDVPELVVGA
jgi:hypothetical protein